MNSSVCSHCGERILPHWTLCPVCALPFADAVSPRTATTETVDDFQYHSAGLHCVQCKSSIGPDAQICPQCHVLIVRRYCSGCSRLIPDQASLCPYCSTPATAKRRRINFYLKAASVLLIGGSVVAGVLYLVYGVPSGGTSKQEPPLVIAPISSPGLIPERRKVDSFPLIPEQVQKTEEQLDDDDATPPRKVTASAPVHSEVESEPENPDVLEQHRSEEVEPMPEDTDPAEGEWQSRGARLKQGRKLTIRASQFMQQGRYTEASIVLKNAITMFPKKTKDLSYGEALYKLGICLRRKGQPEQAIPVLREAMQFPYYRSKVLREVEAATGQLQRTKLNHTRG